MHGVRCEINIGDGYLAEAGDHSPGTARAAMGVFSWCLSTRHDRP